MLRRFLLIILAVIHACPLSAQTKKTTAARKTQTQTKSKSTAKTTTSKAKTPVVPETKELRNLRNKQAALKKKISQSETQLRNTMQSVRKGLSELTILNGQIETHERNIKDIQIQIDSITTNVNLLSAQLDTLSVQLKDKKQKYRRSLLYLFNNRKSQNKLLFILSADNFTQALRRYRYVREYAKYQHVQGMLIQKKEEQVKSVKQQLEQQRTEKNTMLARQRTENQQLVVRKEEQQKAVTALQSKQKQIQILIDQDKKEMAKLNQTIDHYVQLAIEQERRRREEEERKRREAEARAKAEAAAKAEQSGKTSSKTSTTKSKTKETSASKSKAEPMPTYRSNDKNYQLSQNFASNKGRLPVPVTGPYVISARFGSYDLKGVKGVRLDNKGINLTTQGPASARAIFDGEVTYVFSYGGLKNVLVRHGSYISVYCNLSSVAVTQGQKVSTRQALGAIARDASGKYTLHFQLRKETSLLNPESWLAR